MRRKIQYCEDNKTIHSYYVPHERNPCGCGSNLYHLQYDVKNIYGVCNACKEDLYIYNDDVIQENLNKGIWR